MEDGGKRLGRKRGEEVRGEFREMFRQRGYTSELMLPQKAIFSSQGSSSPLQESEVRDASYSEPEMRFHHFSSAAEPLPPPPPPPFASAACLDLPSWLPGMVQ